MGSHGKLVKKFSKYFSFIFTVAETFGICLPSLRLFVGGMWFSHTCHFFDDEYFIAAGEWWRVVLRLRHLIANIIPK